MAPSRYTIYEHFLILPPSLGQKKKTLLHICSFVHEGPALGACLAFRSLPTLRSLPGWTQPSTWPGAKGSLGSPQRLPGGLAAVPCRAGCLGCGPRHTHPLSRERRSQAVDRGGKLVRGPGSLQRPRPLTSQPARPAAVTHPARRTTPQPRSRPAMHHAGNSLRPPSPAGGPRLASAPRLLFLPGSLRGVCREQPLCLLG